MQGGDPPVEFEEACVILAASIHDGGLRQAATKLLNSHSRPVCEEAKEIAKKALETCEAIRVKSEVLRLEVTTTLESHGIAVKNGNRKSDRDDSLFALVSIEISKTDLDRALNLVSKLGYSMNQNYSKGAWRCYKSARKSVQLTRREESTTRLTIAWSLNSLEKITRRIKVVRPGDIEFNFIKLPSIAWWGYYFLRPFRNLIKSEARANPQESDWPYLGTPESLIRPLLEFARLHSSDTILDIGCGDGRIIIEAAKLFNCSCIGIEKDADLANAARERFVKSGLEDTVSILCDSFYGQSISAATVAFLFLPVDSLPYLVDKLCKEMQPGSRIIVHEQARIHECLLPNKTLPIFSGSGATVAHLWEVKS